MWVVLSCIWAVGAGRQPGLHQSPHENQHADVGVHGQHARGDTAHRQHGARGMIWELWFWGWGGGTGCVGGNGFVRISNTRSRSLYPRHANDSTNASYLSSPCHAILKVQQMLSAPPPLPILEKFQELAKGHHDKVEALLDRALVLSADIDDPISRVRRGRRRSRLYLLAFRCSPGLCGNLVRLLIRAVLTSNGFIARAFQ